MPAILNACSGLDVGIDFLLDGVSRADVKEMIVKWEEYFCAFGLVHERIDFACQKGGVLLRLPGLAGTDTSFERRAAIKAEQDEQEKIAVEIGQLDAVSVEVEGLRQRLAALTAQAQYVWNARDEQSTRVNALEAELAQHASNFTAMAQALQRLRQFVARSTP